MAGVAGHSGYRGDPWGRLQRTSYFLAVTTFGTAEDAEEAIKRVQSVHERVRGTAPDGRPYAASDPRLLKWVHVAEVDSFLAAYQRYGRARLDQADRDGYVADAAVPAADGSETAFILDTGVPPGTGPGSHLQLQLKRTALLASAEKRRHAQRLPAWQLYRDPE